MPTEGNGPTIKQQHMTNKPAYLRPRDAANHICTSLSSIYRLMQNKQLKSYKINGTRLIKVADLENLIEAGASA
jgi:hypothetical protein